MVHIFHFTCTLTCRLQLVSVRTSLKFCRLVMGETIFMFHYKQKLCYYCGRGTLDHTVMTFDNSDRKDLKTLKEKEKMLVTNIFILYSQWFFTTPKTEYQFSNIFICHQLVAPIWTGTKFSHFVKIYSFPNTSILHLSKSSALDGKGKMLVSSDGIL